MGNKLSFSRERSIVRNGEICRIESYKIPPFSTNGALRPIFKVLLYNGSVDKCEVNVLSFGELHTACEVLTKKSRPFTKKVHIAAHGMIFQKNCQNGLILYGIILQVSSVFYYLTLTNIAEVNQIVLKAYHERSTPQGRTKNFESRDASVKFTLAKVRQHKDEERESRRAKRGEDTAGTEPEFHCPAVQGSFLFVTGSDAFIRKIIQSLSPEQLERVRSDIESNHQVYTLEQRKQRLAFISSALPSSSFGSQEYVPQLSSSGSSTSAVEPTLVQHPVEKHTLDMANDATDVDDDDSLSADLSIIDEDEFDTAAFWACITIDQKPISSEAFATVNDGILNNQDEKPKSHKRPSTSNEMVEEDIKFIFNNYFKRPRTTSYEPSLEDPVEESDNE